MLGPRGEASTPDPAPWAKRIEADIYSQRRPIAHPKYAGASERHLKPLSEWPTNRTEPRIPHQSGYMIESVAVHVLESLDGSRRGGR